MRFIIQICIAGLQIFFIGTDINNVFSLLKIFIVALIFPGKPWHSRFHTQWFHHVLCTQILYLYGFIV